MKVTAATVFVAQTGWRRAVLIELETDAGVTGIGEVGIAYGAGGNAAAALAEEMIERFVLGRDPGRIELIWNNIYDTAFWTKGGSALHSAAMSGIEHALWDIKGKALGVPVYELMGGPILESLPVYANGWWHGFTSDAELAEAARGMVLRGYSRLKFYPLGVPDPVTVVRHPVRRATDSDIGDRVRDRIARIKDRCESKVELILDFGGGLTNDQLFRVFERLEGLDILFVEEPVDPSLPGALANMGRRTHIPIAAGERVYLRYGFHSLLATNAVQIVQPDVCNTGGIMEARRIAAIAEIHNARVAPHNYGSALATVIAAQLSATLPNFMLLECFPDYRREKDYRTVITLPLEDQVQNGEMPLPKGPGLGAELDRRGLADCVWRRIGT